MSINIQSYMYGAEDSCVQDGNHLTAVDVDGYCKLCGYKDSISSAQPHEPPLALRLTVYRENLKKEEVRNFMLMALDTDVLSYIDSDGKLSYTTLAENAAFTFEHEDWLDSGEHWVWDLAIEITERYKKK